MFHDYYSGSNLLKPLSEKVGIEVDRLNFVVSQFTALCLAFGMRRWLHPSSTSVIVRHIFSFVVGILLSYFCFGNEIFHLLGLAIACGLIIQLYDSKLMALVVFTISLGYLAYIHIKRLIYNYGSYNLDITGPLMVMVQRISGLGFSIQDGVSHELENMSPYRKKYATPTKPTFLEYFGYLFQFQCLLAGPNIPFKDYQEFITGENFKTNKKMKIGNEPSVVRPVVQKIGVSVLCISIYLFLSPKFSMAKAKNLKFITDLSIFGLLYYIIVATTLTRFMYYHAWILAEAVCNASGLGFSGYDEKGNAKWDLATNVDILKFEFSNSMRNAVSSWNTGTNNWLRFIVYERLETYENYKILCTFLLSAVWHGFYPGYYITFATAALFVSSARIIRKIVRPYFITSIPMKFLYDCCTFIVTRIAVAYFTFPFIVFDFETSINIYKKMFFCLHILALISFFTLPAIKRFLPKPPAAAAAVN